MADLSQKFSYIYFQSLDDLKNKYPVSQIPLVLLKQRKIGLVYDHASSHVFDDVMYWIEQYNFRTPKSEKLVVQFLDPCLNSIYHPPDVVMNARLKRLVRSEYHDLINLIVIDPSNPSKLKYGGKIPISIETLIGFVGKSCVNSFHWN